MFFSASRASKLLNARVSFASFLKVSVCATAVLTAGSANAQTGPAPSDQNVEQVVVTGTRVQRDGYEAPTPVSVVSADQIQTSGTPNIADYVDTLPAVSGSSTPVTTANSVGAGRQGIDSINLHNIGDVRTLTLLDGRRIGGMINTGVVDASELPQQLISRVDIVTGGASASYGSDALSGVVNYVLDTKFTGLKADISGGETTYGDDQSWLASVSYGTGFLNDRGHFLLSGGASRENGVYNPSNRPWTQPGWAYITNPAYTTTNGQPLVLREPQVALDTATLGGAIACSATSTCKSLRGIAFGPGGSMYNLVFGPIVSDPIMSGGTMGDNNLRSGVNNSLVPRQDRQNLFTRASYDLSENWSVFAEGLAAHLDTDTKYYYGGFSNTLTVHPDNPYMPAALATAITGLGLTSVPFGTMKGDNGASGAHAEHGYLRGTAGIDGTVGALGTDWKVSAYYEFARASLWNTATSATELPNWNLAIDAVRGPGGSIVCRSTLTNPTNGCVPYDVFGTGVNSKAQIAYVTGNPYQHAHYEENVMAFNVAGNPFSIWAGPVSLAFGAEHRTESAHGYADPITQSSPGNWDTTGGLPTIGGYQTSDAFIESVIPLANGAPWAKSVDVDVAVRAVQYTNGTYAPWKIGAEYDTPIDGVRFRGVASLDVREANLADRYAGVFQAQSSFQDPNNNGKSTTARSLASGNPNLKPEVGKTYSAGVVLQPAFLPGFNASIDYYQVRITGAISSLSIQQIVNLCFAGNQTSCALITATPGAANQFDIVNKPLNLASENREGVDFESSYGFKLADLFSGMDGAVNIRGLASDYITYSVNPGLPGSIVTQNVGSVTQPRWRYDMSVNYLNGPLSLTGTVRGVSSSVSSNNFIQCTTGCPTSTTNFPTYANDQIASAIYFDVATSYTFGGDGQYEVYFNARNIFNKDPAIVPNGPTGYQSWTNNPVNGSQFDVLGRVYRAGFRLKI